MEEEKKQTSSLAIEVDKLKGTKLMCATPAYGGAVHINFKQSELSLQHMLSQCGIECTFVTMGNESLISRARNSLTNTFLASDYTHLMWIDGDIQFSAVDVLVMLHFKKDFIGGAYPMKGFNWEHVKEAVLKHPDISPEDLEKCAATWTTHFFEGRTEVFPMEPTEVKELGTGFLLTSRKVYETIADKADTYLRAPNQPDLTEEIKDFFTVGTRDHIYESEDYSLCRQWREAGGQVWCCGWFALNHCGSHVFKGDLNRVIQLLGKV